MDPLTGYSFASDFVAGKASGYFEHSTADLPRLIAARDAQPSPPWTQEQIAELAAFNETVGNAGGAKLAGKLADPETLVVVTGQQPNLLVSPMFILLKALSVRALAARFAEQAKRPVLPVFWIASDDHDFAELSECWIEGKDELVDIGRYVSRGEGVGEDSPAYEWKLDSSRDRILAMLSDVLSGSAKDETIAVVADALRPPAQFEMAFARLLAAMLGDPPVLFLAPRLKSMRTRQIPVLQNELKVDGATSDAVGDTGREMQRSGYPPMIKRDPAVLNFFYMKDGVRARLVQANGSIRAESPTVSQPVHEFASRAELDAEIAAHPERFSPNVVLRPIIQDAVLPTICYVAGPGEIAYLAQLRGAYAVHSAFQAAVLPRAFATIIDSQAKQALDQLGLPICAFESGRLAEVVGSRNPDAARVVSELQRIRSCAEQEIGRARALPELAHQHLASAFEKTARAVTTALGKFERRVARHYGSRDPKFSSFLRLARVLEPLGRAQERVLGPVSFGGTIAPVQLARKVDEQLDFTNPHPQVVTL